MGHQPVRFYCQNCHITVAFGPGSVYSQAYVNVNDVGGRSTSVVPCVCDRVDRKAREAGGDRASFLYLGKAPRLGCTCTVKCGPLSSVRCRGLCITLQETEGHK